MATKEMHLRDMLQPGKLEAIKALPGQVGNGLSSRNFERAAADLLPVMADALVEAQELLRECMGFVAAHAGGYQSSHELKQMHPKHAETLASVMRALGRSEEDIQHATGPWR